MLTRLITPIAMSTSSSSSSSAQAPTKTKTKTTAANEQEVQEPIIPLDDSDDDDDDSRTDEDYRDDDAVSESSSSSSSEDDGDKDGDGATSTTKTATKKTTKKPSPSSSSSSSSSSASPPRARPDIAKEARAACSPLQRGVVRRVFQYISPTSSVIVRLRDYWIFADSMAQYPPTALSVPWTEFLAQDTNAHHRVQRVQLYPNARYTQWYRMVSLDTAMRFALINHLPCVNELKRWKLFRDYASKNKSKDESFEHWTMFLCPHVCGCSSKSSAIKCVTSENDRTSIHLITGHSSYYAHRRSTIIHFNCFPECPGYFMSHPEEQEKLRKEGRVVPNVPTVDPPVRANDVTTSTTTAVVPVAKPTTTTSSTTVTTTTASAVVALPLPPPVPVVPKTAATATASPTSAMPKSAAATKQTTTTTATKPTATVTAATATAATATTTTTTSSAAAVAPVSTPKNMSAVTTTQPLPPTQQPPPTAVVAKRLYGRTGCAASDCSAARCRSGSRTGGATPTDFIFILVVIVINRCYYYTQCCSCCIVVRTTTAHTTAPIGVIDIVVNSNDNNDHHHDNNNDGIVLCHSNTDNGDDMQLVLPR